MRLISTLFACAALAVAAPLARGQTNNSYPMLMSVRPSAAVIGQSTEHEISARYSLQNATEIIVSGPGVTGEVVAQPEPEKKPEDDAGRKGRRGRRGKKADQPKLKVKFTVAPDALPGVRDFRIMTPQGASTMGQLVIARDGLVVESADNDTPAKAQVIGVPATVCGALEKGEDVDCYRFKADAGQSLVFHVRSQRLLNRLHDMQSRVDPLISLKTATGVTLATSDNYYAGDPLLAHAFEQAGDYLLEIRDVRYQGNADWTYAIEISGRPFITQAHPLAVRPGVETKLALVGYNLPTDAFATVTLPAETPAGLTWISPTVAGQNANEFAVLATGQPGVDEASGENNTVSTGQAVTLPGVISGRIESPSDQDCFVFTAVKGERYTFEVIARRGWSGLDPYLRILGEQGNPVSEADDSQQLRVTTADSLLENWTAPADGKYAIELRDLHLRGGAQFTYAIEVTRAEPHFTLELDTDKTLLAPGVSSVFYVRAVRKNGFAGEIQLTVEGLPPGVTAVCGRILPNTRYADACVILRAAPDADEGVANIRVLGTAVHPVANGEPLKLSAVARPLQEYYSPGGGRGNYPVDFHTVSVADLMDLRAVHVGTTAVELKPGTSQRIDVTVERAPEFRGNVTLDMIFQHLEQPFGHTLPVGVTVDVVNSKTLLTGEETKGFISLKAAADAPPVEKQLVPVLAHVSINFVMKLTFSGEPVYVTVTPK
jgi:hypothetical protein